ncbi:hypothetical protein [Flammeovirga sp. OC4]|uniref:hypothetical protein n=1 Tax=Flammeovirga sp. OC4 TaxID=1382345 RepID=UPI0005C581A7|nr:hypothetical protein [Flammeovirga sp. OC4]
MRQTSNLIFLLSIIFFSCSFYTSDDYISWVEKHLRQTLKGEMLSFNVQLQPKRYVALKNSKLNKNLDYNTALDNAEGNMAFLIDIQVSNDYRSVFSSYSMMKNYFAYTFPKDIRLLQGEMEIENIFFHLESGLMKSNTFRLDVVFDETKIKKSLPFLIVLSDSTQLEFNLLEESKMNLL